MHPPQCLKQSPTATVATEPTKDSSQVTEATDKMGKKQK